MCSSRKHALTTPLQHLKLIATKLTTKIRKKNPKRAKEEGKVVDQVITTKSKLKLQLMPTMTQKKLNKKD